ncbi:hypothetical protein Tco_0105205 [Tanacetum coccineum]
MILSYSESKCVLKYTQPIPPSVNRSRLGPRVRLSSSGPSDDAAKCHLLPVHQGMPCSCSSGVGLESSLQHFYGCTQSSSSFLGHNGFSILTASGPLSQLVLLGTNKSKGLYMT